MRKVAIIGSGPSGCFTAQGLLKARPDWQVDVYDSLPVPYGLVRYGVAPDHQGTKAVSRQFDRVFERQGARFFGNVTLGKDVTLERMRAAYDAVVLATGLSGDREPEIGKLDGVIGAGALTRALYDHPDADNLPDIAGDVVILGNGNVAVDVLRLLAKSESELEGSDLSQRATEWLVSRQIDSLTIVGRSPAPVAKFDPVMIRELGKLQAVTVRVADLPAAEDDKLLAALHEIDGLSAGVLPVTFRFGCALKGYEQAQGHLKGLVFETADGPEALPADTLITAIGFQCDGSLKRDEVMATADAPDEGRIAEGLYAAGWFRRGPRGTIPENRAESLALAKRIVADVEAGPEVERAGHDGLGLAQDIVDYDGWKRLDAVEKAEAAAGRSRKKIATRADMLRLARSVEEIN
nr:FAD-dependent oxidoreductase [uncultured Celeribacter sp.]